MFGDKAKTVVATKSARNDGLSPSRQAAAQEPDGVRRFSRPCLLALLALFLLLASLAGCDFVNEISAPTTTVPPTPTVAPPVAATESPAPTIAPAAAITPSATGIVLRVSVGSPPSDLPKYDRGEWRHWIDEDSDCQNARQEALIAESSIAVAFRSDEQCHVTSGRWEGPYTGEVVTSPGDLDIDHMVPLENAHRSGAWAWDRERKREYANYLGYENHLIATISSANRSKGSKGPEAWRPPLEKLLVRLRHQLGHSQGRLGTDGHRGRICGPLGDARHLRHAGVAATRPGCCSIHPHRNRIADSGGRVALRPLRPGPQLLRLRHLRRSVGLLPRRRWPRRRPSQTGRQR